MNQRRIEVTRVGELRPSQILYSFGIGSIIDLPNLSVMIMGLDDWNTQYLTVIQEERLLQVVRYKLGFQVERLCYPPYLPQSEENWNNPFDESFKIGIPVAPFPRWVRCPQCSLLAPLNFGVFEMRTKPFHPEQTRYVHVNCPNSPGEPTILPVRFLVACENGHLDDFPWLTYVHQGKPCERPILRLREWGVTGSVSEVVVSCDTCKKQRRMRDAFKDDGIGTLPSCRGRQPHLRSFDPDGCNQPLKTILLGASNSWFPITLSALHIPSSNGELAQLIDQHWATLEAVTSLEILSAFRKANILSSFIKFSDIEILEAIQKKRNEMAREIIDEDELNLRLPEWETFIQPDPRKNSDDFELREIASPTGFEQYFKKTVLVERIREVRALIGFTRIEAPGNFDDVGEIPEDRTAPLSRIAPAWIPATEVRGEGIFLQFNEDYVANWCKKVFDREQQFMLAHRRWRLARHYENPDAGFPGIRYILLHTFAHALMRQISIECGYTAASIRERIYSQNPGGATPAMTGVLIYTGASDSEGTLGGLVSLGEPMTLARLIEQSLEQIRLCASDPLCAEHAPGHESLTLHGAACHACLFSPETSCEHGNKYLDRAVLVKTFDSDIISFFDS